MPDLTDELDAKSSYLSRLALVSGACLCFLAVAIGAFGAHALADILQQNQRLDTFELANRYQFYHGLALFLIGIWRTGQPFADLYLSVYCFVLGTIIFSGSLYALSLSNIGVFGAITPIGGLLLLFSWALLIYRSLRC